MLDIVKCEDLICPLGILEVSQRRLSGDYLRNQRYRLIPLLYYMMQLKINCSLQ